MNKKTRLKVAALILFWFGVIWQFLSLVGYTLEYHLHGTFEGHTPEVVFYDWLSGAGYIAYSAFFHVVHIIAGFWLASGRQKGVYLGISVSLYEILAFLVPHIDPILFTPVGIPIRILFVFVIFLIISGRKELVNLKSENWRPWKKPI